VISYPYSFCFDASWFVACPLIYIIHSVERIAHEHRNALGNTPVMHCSSSVCEGSTGRSGLESPVFLINQADRSVLVRPRGLACCCEDHRTGQKHHHRDHDDFGAAQLLLRLRRAERLLSRCDRRRKRHHRCHRCAFHRWPDRTQSNRPRNSMLKRRRLTRNDLTNKGALIHAPTLHTHPPQGQA